MTRVHLKNRRLNTTLKVSWRGRVDLSILITFGFDDTYNIKEAFVAGFRDDVEVNAMACDACILLSRGLQHGDTLSDLANALLENRAEGETSGSPSSMIGAIVRTALQLQNEIKGEGHDTRNDNKS